MSAGASVHAAAASHRLDPFAFPSSTTARFAVLILLAAGGTAFAYDLIVGGPTAWNDRYFRCGVEADIAGLAVSPDPGRFRAAAEPITAGFTECERGVDALRNLVGLSAAVGALVVLVACAVLAPRLLIWRQKLRPLDASVYPDADAVLQDLFRALPTRCRPRVLVRPFSRSLGGRAFGVWPRYAVKLNRQVLVRASTDPSTLAAIARHELAHLRNRDVEITQVALASSRLFLVSALVPLVVVAATWGTADIGALSWRIVVLGVLVLAAAAMVVRAREHYADLRAVPENVAAGCAPFDPLAFPAPNGVPSSGALARLRTVRDVVVRMHPTVRRRRAVVDQPALLFQASFGEALITGITVGIGFLYLEALLRRAFGLYALAASTVPAFAIGLVVAGSVGVGLWRTAVDGVITGSGRRLGVRTALGLATGILVGDVVISPVNTAWYPVATNDPALGLVTAGALVAACLAFTAWSGAIARVRFAGDGRVVGARAAAPAIVVGGAVFGALFLLWHLLTAGLDTIGPTGILLWLLTGTGKPVVFVPLVIAACFTLAAPSTARLDVVVAPAVFIAVAVVALDAVLPQSIYQSAVQFALAGAGRGSFQIVYVLATFVAVTCGLVALVVLVLTRAGDADGRAAQAVLAAGLAGFALIVGALGGAEARNCLAGACRTGGPIATVVTNLPMAASALGVTVVLVGLYLGAGRAWSTLRGSVGRPHGGPPGGAGRHRIWGAAVVVLTAALLVAVVVPDLEQAVPQPSATPEPTQMAFDAAPVPSHTLTVPEACRLFAVTFDLSDSSVELTNVSRRMATVINAFMASESPALWAFGASERDRILATGVFTMEGFNAASLYCRLRVPS